MGAKIEKPGSKISFFIYFEGIWGGKSEPATGYIDNYALSEGYDLAKVSPGCQYTSATLKTTISSLLRRPEAFFDHFFAFGAH